MAGYRNIDPRVGKNTQFIAGVSGNPKGKPKGSLNLSTLVKDMLSDPKLTELVMSKQRPAWWSGLSEKRFAEAVVMAQIIKALRGDTRAFLAIQSTLGERGATYTPAPQTQYLVGIKNLRESSRN